MLSEFLIPASPEVRLDIPLPLPHMGDIHPTLCLFNYSVLKPNVSLAISKPRFLRYTSPAQSAIPLVQALTPFLG